MGCVFLDILVEIKGNCYVDHKQLILQSALQAKPMCIVSVVLILDTWEICLVFCKHKRTSIFLYTFF